MSKPIYLHAALQLAASSDNKPRDDGDKQVTGVAYSGDAVTQWGDRFVIDLETLQAKTPIAMLFEHGRANSVGVIDAIGNDGKTLTIEDGRIFAGIESDPLPRRIADKAARGFPYELSVGIFDGSVERFEDGKTVKINGRKFIGPITVIRNAMLREVSIVALGADDGAHEDHRRRDGAAVEQHRSGVWARAGKCHPQGKLLE
jgi:hypothetical protein